MPIRAILFDKDGTLVDFDRTWGPAVQTVLQHLARGDEILYRELCAVSGLIDGLHFLPDSPLIDEPTSVFAMRWATLLGRVADSAFAEKIDRLLCQATTAHLSPIGDPKTILGELARRGYRLGMITNDAEATARTHARKLGFHDLLTFIAGYDSGFGTKPAPAPIIAFARTVGVSIMEIVMVGDSDIDVATARAAGARAILVLTGPKSDRLRQIEADGVIASIAELAAWLETGHG